MHYPTDINLLLDAMRKVITLVSAVCAESGLSDWRQSEHNKRSLKKSYRKAQQLKRSTSKDPKKKAEREQAIKDAHLNYLNTVIAFLKKASLTLKKIKPHPLVTEKILAMNHYMNHAHRQIDQILRRVILGESIDHDEKVFSVFEEHTEWISKGKAGVPQELGRKVCIVEDQYGFILNHRIMEKQADSDVTVCLVKEVISCFLTWSVAVSIKDSIHPKISKNSKLFWIRSFCRKKGKLPKSKKSMNQQKRLFKPVNSMQPSVIQDNHDIS